MEKEMKSLQQQHNVWDLVELPPGRKVVGSESSRRRLELMAQSKDTKQDWWLKAMHRNTEQTTVKPSAQW